MKAIFFEQHGEIDVLKYGDLPDPQPKTGEALVRVRAVALNHLDIWVRRGWSGLRLEMPHITGSDIAGEIVEVNGVANWKAGTRVVVNPGVVTREDEWTRRGEDSISPGYRIIGEQMRGGLAELVAVPINNLFSLPAEIEYTRAAATLLTGTTCWRMLFKVGKLKPGETVLVVGSGGGVNSLSIQLARKIGADVIALAGNNNKLKKAQELGAGSVINYRECPSWHVEVMKLTKGRGADLVIDNVGAATFEKSLRAVARGGRIVTVGNTSGYNIQFDNRLIFTKQISLIGSTMGSRQDFIDSTTFIWRENIVPAIDRVAPLSDGINMIQRLQEGKQFGKIILTP
ncbi:MAG: alcohol dehydrogenase [Candidatus Dadabacteria bacterium]|nr:MAG: alcohol dehydrogenase [Candidatus Dadabacteria bacterium]